MRRLAVRLQRCLIFIDLVVVEAVSVIPVLNNVEAQASRLVLLGMLRIMAHRFQVFGHMPGFTSTVTCNMTIDHLRFFESLVANSHADTQYNLIVPKMQLRNQSILW